MSTYFKHGSWNVHCDVCGFKFKADEVQKRWDGLIVCSKDYEQDHPQKYLRVHEDRQDVPFVRKQSDDTYLNVCYMWDRSAYADLASADCATADNTTYTYVFLYTLKYGYTPGYATPTYSFDGWFLPQYA